jgi:TRAP transporter 4TM/12TM fusion protein
MGAAAFLMADMLEINYLEIASAALVPGLIYYSAVFLLVHLLAKKRSRTGTYTPIKIESEPILPRLYMLLPVAVLVGALASGYTIQRSALYGILSCILIGIISPKKYRLSIIEIFNMVVEATRRAATVAAPLAGCGIIIGIISMTGLASRMSVVISSLGSGFIWVGLLISMIGCMLLGMALPTLAAYLTAYVLFIPTLLNLGIGILPANLFIFYFGIFAHITPPVCIASYTAAGIAGSKSWDTGWKAFTYSLCAFFAPFVFVYQPGILLMGTFWEIVSAIFTLAFGTMMLTFGLAGYVFKHLTRLERTLSILSASLSLSPSRLRIKSASGWPSR